MIGIILALYEEAKPIIQYCKLDLADDRLCYQGEFFDHACSLFLCSPNLNKKKQQQKLIQWYHRHSFSYIINIGLAGALTPDDRLGNSYYIKDIYFQEELLTCTTIDPLRRFSQASLATVNTILYTKAEKENCLTKSINTPKVVDLEAGFIYKILQQQGFSTKHLLIFKIVGDRLNDHLYLEQEKLIYSLFKKSPKEILYTLPKIGIFNFCKIYFRKTYLQRKILKSIKFIVCQLTQTL